MSNLFRDSFNHLLDVFGDPTLGVYYVDKSKAEVNSYGEITGGTVYLVKKCPVRGKVVTDPLEVKTVQDESASYIEWSTLTAPAVFKCSATDLIKGGVLDSNGNYEPAIDPVNPSPGTGTMGLLNMYVIWKGVVYDIAAVQKGIVYGGDVTALYLTASAVYDYSTIAGKADLVIQDGDTPVDPPDPPKPGEYTVTVDGVLYGSYAAGVVVTLTVPTKPGYTFNGWSSEQVTVTDNTFTMPETNVVITSLWVETPVDPIYFSVTIINPAKTPSSSTYAVKDGDSIMLQAGEYAGHTFSEWSITSGRGQIPEPTAADTTLIPASDCTVECVWVQNADPRHTVTFIGFDRAAEKHLAGDRVSVYPGLKEGYEFDKWTSEPSVTFSPRSDSANASFVMPDSDITVTANWTEVLYTVNFYLRNDPSDSHALWETVAVKANTAITAPADPTGSPYAPEDKVFTGWYTAAEGGTEFNLEGGVTADTDLYAHWKGVDRTITFDTDGGNTIEPRVVEDGMPIGELPVPVKAGFKFVRWTDELGRETITADTIVNYDMTIVAEWTPDVVETGEWETNKGEEITVLFTRLYRDAWKVTQKANNGLLTMAYNQHSFPGTHTNFTYAADGLDRIKGIGGQIYMGKEVPADVVQVPWSMHYNNGVNANACPVNVEGFTAYSRYDGLPLYGEEGSGTGLNANSWFTEDDSDPTIIAVAYLFAKQAYGQDPTVPGTLFTINGTNLFNEPFDQSLPTPSTTIDSAVTYRRRFSIMNPNGKGVWYRVRHIVRLNEPNADGLAWYRLELSAGTDYPV